MRILVYGLGRSGLAVALLAQRQGHQVRYYDQRATGEDIDAARNAGLARTDHPLADDSDLCIAAPGVPFQHPQLAALRRRGTETIGEVEWVFRTFEAPMIGVTGTAGKSTVTAWAAHALRRAGIDAVAGGNIDPPLSAVAGRGKLLVVELSSFQLERCPTLRPRVAVVLNLGSDHLDRHGSLAAYHQAKRNIARNLTPEDRLVINADDPTLAEWATTTPATVERFAGAGPADAYLDGDLLVARGSSICQTGELKLPGRHNHANALAVALAVTAAGIAPQHLKPGLTSFEGLDGRLAIAGRLGDITLISDSYATRPLAVAAALAASREPVVWIGGGLDKGADFSDLAELVRAKVVLFIAIGEAATRFRDRVGRWTRALRCPEVDGAEALRCALDSAVDHLKREHRGCGTVLFAPMAASFDQFRDYRHRATVFRGLVEELEDRWTPAC